LTASSIQLLNYCSQALIVRTPFTLTVKPTFNMQTWFFSCSSNLGA